MYTADLCCVRSHLIAGANATGSATLTVGRRAQRLNLRGAKGSSAVSASAPRRQSHASKWVRSGETGREDLHQRSRRSAESQDGNTQKMGPIRDIAVGPRAAKRITWVAILDRRTSRRPARVAPKYRQTPGESFAAL